MSSGCPSEEKLQAFSRGELSADERDGIAAHVSECSHCGPRLGTVSPKVHSSAPTHFDSPGARRRTTLDDQPLATPALKVSPDARPDFDALTADTFISGEHSDPRVIALGYQRGNQIGRYVVLGRLGKGGMGEVYAAYDPDLDRKVAIKILKSELRSSGAADELRLRLLREAQAMAKLSHPNVVTVHDVGLIGDQVFLAMEYVEGESISQWLKSKPRTWAQILDIFISAGRGLAAAHAVGIIHRDFKPDNVVIGLDHRVKVMDFGLAQAQLEVEAVRKKEKEADEPHLTETSGAMRRRITQPGAIMGTPAFMSPEQLNGIPVDARSDQFSFCVALYEALYGERPFAGDTIPGILAEILQNRVRPAPANKLVPPRIRKLLVRGLDSNPNQRFRSMDSLLIQLSRRKSAVVRQWTAIGAGAVVLLTLTAAVVMTRRAQSRCAQIANRLEGVWDEKLRAQAHDAFAATKKPWAERAFNQSAQHLDAYTRRWVDVRRETCEAGGEADDEVLGRRIVCLGRRLADVQAVGQLFAHADAEIVEKSVNATLALPSIDGCLAEPAALTRPTPDLEEVRLSLAAVKVRLDAGKYTEGLALAVQAEERARAAKDRGAVLAEAKRLHGVLAARLGDAANADRLLEEAILLAEPTHEDEIVASAWIERLGLLAVKGQLERAENAAKFAQAALDRLGQNVELRASLANNLGVLSYAKGAYGAAEEQYETSVRLRAQALGPQHPSVARSYSNLGTALLRGGKHDEAIAAYKKAQAIEEATLDPSHPAVAETLNNLGNALNAKKDRAAAIEAFRRAIEIKSENFGSESPQVAVPLSNLAAALLEDGKLDQARDALEKSLRIKEASAGKNAIALAPTLTNLAALERLAKRPERAIDADRRALLLRERVLGPEHPDLAFNLTGLGLSLIAMHREKDAVASLERAVALRRNSDAALLEESKEALETAKAARGTVKPGRAAAPPSPGRKGSAR